MRPRRAGDPHPPEHVSIGYEFVREEESRDHAAALDRRFSKEQLLGLRVYRVRWNGNYLVEATFSGDVADEVVDDARALLGESGVPVHPDDLMDYKRGTREWDSGGRGWFRRYFGG